MKKLWPQQVEEKKQADKQKLCRDVSRLCRDKASDKSRNFVPTKSEDKLCRNKVLVCRDKVLLCRDIDAGFDQKAPKTVVLDYFQVHFTL